MTTGKNIALTIWVFVSKVMSLLFNIWAFQVVLVVKNPFANAGDGFSPWVRKIPWRRAHDDHLPRRAIIASAS